MVQILIAWLVNSVSLFIISKLPLGVEIDGFKKALFSAAVFGILNAILLPFLKLVFFVPNLFTLFLLRGLFLVIINAIILGLAAWLVEGFRLRWGFWSAFVGAIALGIVNSLLYSLLPAKVF